LAPEGSCGAAAAIYTYDLRPAHYIQMQIHKRKELKYTWDALSFNLRDQ